MRILLTLILLSISFCSFSQKNKSPVREIYTDAKKEIIYKKNDFIDSENTLDAILRVRGIQINAKSEINYHYKAVDISIDNKLVFIPATDKINLLRSIPLGIINSIELIKNADVFYSAETGILLNIITENLTSSNEINIINFSLTQNEVIQYNSFMNFKRAYKKLFFQINTAFSGGNNHNKKETISIVTDNDKFLNNNRFITKNNFFFESTMFYDLNIRDKIGVNFKSFLNKGRNQFDFSSENTEPIFNIYENQQKSTLFDLELYYLQVLDKEGTKLKFTGNISSFDKEIISHNIDESFLNRVLTYDFSNLGNLKLKNERFKIDLLIPKKYISVDLNSGFEYFKQTNIGDNLFVINKINFSFQQKNIYFLLNKDLKKIKLGIGAKIAKTKSSSDKVDLSKNIYSILPSANFSYAFKKAHKVDITYSRKLNQTNTLLLNNIINSFDSFDNDLLFDTSDNLSAVLSYYDFNYLSFDYFHRNTQIQPYFNIVSNNLSFQKIKNAQYYNINLSLPISVNIFKNEFFKYLNKSKNNSYFIDVGSNFLNFNNTIDPNYYVNLYGSSNIFYDFRLNVNASYISRSKYPFISTQKNILKLDFSLNKKIFSEKVNFSIGVNDLFDSFVQNTIFDDGLSIENNNNIQKFTIGASYNFSSLINKKQ
jgi:hypothetical protein